jgi:hypothetical protein
MKHISLIGAAVAVAACLLVAAWAFHDSQKMRSQHTEAKRAAWEEGYVAGANQAVETILSQISHSNTLDVAGFDAALEVHVRNGLSNNPYKK